MVFSYDFTPATNKEGKSLGTFMDYEVKDGESPLTDRKTGQPVLDEDGQQVMRPWSFVSLLFEVKGRVAGQSRVIKLTTNGRFGTGGDLEEALKLMGWVNEHVKVIFDEDGLEVESVGEVTTDEDGLEVVAEDLTELTRESFAKFVETVKGCKFWMTVTRDAKGFYRIEPGSLTPKV
jgi:hypothetical protein